MSTLHLEPKSERNLIIKIMYLIIGALKFIVNNSNRPNEHVCLTSLHIKGDVAYSVLFVSCCSLISRSKMQGLGKSDYLI